MAFLPTPHGPNFLHVFLSSVNSMSGSDRLPSLCGFNIFLSSIPVLLFIPVKHRCHVLHFCRFLCCVDKSSQEYNSQNDSHRICNCCRESKALICAEEISHGYGTHKGCRYSRDPVILFSRNRYMLAVHNTIMASVWFVQLKYLHTTA